MTRQTVICIGIDPNVRVRGNQTYASFDDVEMPHCAGDLGTGMKVLAVELESNMGADAVVSDIDYDREFVYLAVEWRTWRDAGEGTSLRQAAATAGPDTGD